MKQKSQINFGSQLCALRKEAGLSQTELGKKVGLSKRMVIYYERHASRIPKIDLIKAFAIALKCSIDNLLETEINIPINPTKNRLWKKLKKVETFSENQQKAVISIIDSIEKTKE